MLSEAIKTFVHSHRSDDVRQLALKYGGAAAKSLGESFDLSLALDQIQGWQTARRKLPSWAACDGIVYPPHLNMEQCSSETTARYKSKVLARLLGDDRGEATFIDLTGGFGVDFSFLSEGFGKGVYVEQHSHLCQLVAHNLRVLQRSTVEVLCADGVDYLHRLPAIYGAHSAEGPSDTAEKCSRVIYLDPARRDSHGRKVAALSDCHPDVTLLRDELLQKADVVMIKLSPMLDVHAALAALSPEGVGTEVHIVCSQGECKELLVVLSHRSAPLRMVCVDDDNEFAYEPSANLVNTYNSVFCSSIGDISGTLLVPHAGIMKAQCFSEIAARFSICKLSKTSHLFVAVSPVADFPGRQYRILSVATMNKRDLRQALAGITQANIAVRHFPLTADQLRQKLKLRDGSSTYLFATTIDTSQGSKHIIIVAERETIQDAAATER